MGPPGAPVAAGPPHRVTGLVCNGDAIRALAVGSTVHARELLEMAVTEGVGLAVLSRSNSSAALDVGQVVVSARARGWPVLAVNSSPLLAVAPDVAVETLP